MKQRSSLAWDTNFSLEVQVYFSRNFSTGIFDSLKGSGADRNGAAGLDRWRSCSSREARSWRCMIPSMPIICGLWNHSLPWNASANRVALPQGYFWGRWIAVSWSTLLEFLWIGLSFLHTSHFGNSHKSSSGRLYGSSSLACSVAACPGLDEGSSSEAQQPFSTSAQLGWISRWNIEVKHTSSSSLSSRSLSDHLHIDFSSCPTDLALGPWTRRWTIDGFPYWP